MQHTQHGQRQHCSCRLSWRYAVPSLGQVRACMPATADDLGPRMPQQPMQACCSTASWSPIRWLLAMQTPFSALQPALASSALGSTQLLFGVLANSRPPQACGAEGQKAAHQLFMLEVPGAEAAHQTFSSGRLGSAFGMEFQGSRSAAHQACPRDWIFICVPNLMDRSQVRRLSSGLGFDLGVQQHGKVQFEKAAGGSPGSRPQGAWASQPGGSRAPQRWPGWTPGRSRPPSSASCPQSAWPAPRSFPPTGADPTRSAAEAGFRV